jgi:hypothetical protein
VRNVSPGNVTGNGLQENSTKEVGRSSILLTKEKSGYQNEYGVKSYPETIKFLLKQLLRSS